MTARFRKSSYDAIVVGAGPNGLSCAITAARAGLSVLIVEKSDVLGGGAKTRELTLPGFHHDVCSAVHPLALASPFFQSLPLQEFGLEWIHAPAELAHPFEDGTALLVKRSVDETAAQLGRDGPNYKKFFGPLAERFDDLSAQFLSPLARFPRHPFALAKFGINALLSAKTFSNRHFTDDKTKALFLGVAAHSAADLSSAASASVGVVLQIAAHCGGWPIPRGGSGNLSRALAAYFLKLGGEIILDFEVRSIAELPAHEHLFFDLTPRQILKIAGNAVPEKVAAKFREFRYGAGAFKLDWALNRPIPWTNPLCATAPTVHVAGDSAAIIESEACIQRGKVSERPYVLLCQPTLFDQSRAPAGAHIAWAYCHVPHGFEGDVTDLVENQIERFAPGFKETILKKSIMGPRRLEEQNPNLVGGDISGGAIDLKQLLLRPRPAFDPYAIDGHRLWICSSSTPPGPSVHGMCGFLAARAALRL